MSRHGEGGEAEPSGDHGSADSGRESVPHPDPGARATFAAADEVRRKRQIVLLLVGIGLAAVLALAALFFLGTRLSLTGADSATPAAPGTSTASPTPTSTRTPTPTPTPTLTARPSPGAPVTPGIHAWDELGGGECIDPYPGPWAGEYTVVDCGLPHPAQLVTRAPFPTDADRYPGAETIAAQLCLLCSTPTVIGPAAAAYPDLRIEGAYPATAEQWDVGQRDYFCFVTRANGEPLTGTLAAAP
ncbi:hypothetical protein [Planctomonas psychrotolerans]|uniref:hypothetical protein n=1 Tax=Planctomonas psychrotolerans TaxID=2528712 RepID=UPI0012392B87|nr:hypothetical protein [Planctomonas psychrotolerans]